MNYINELLNGKSVRITYYKQNDDFMGDGGGWTEELWTYDNNTQLYKIFYPVSTYEKDFFTYHTESEAEIELKYIDTDETIKSVKVEDNIGNSIDIKELKDIALKIFNNLDEERLRLFVVNFQNGEVK